MITLHDKSTPYTKALAENGLYVLDQLTITAETTEDIFGNYELNMELELIENVPKELYLGLQVDNIIKVIDEGVVQLFRIAQAESGLDTITIYARHITIADSLNLWLGNVKPTNLNGQQALNWLKERTEPQCNLKFVSNILKTNTADYVRKSLYDALCKDDNSLLNRWGGEIKRDGYSITINGHIGEDKSKSIIIKEGVNLISFDGATNIDDVVTVIHPIGFDGIQAGEVKSPKVNDYSMEFHREFKYEEVKVRTQNEDGSFTEGYETLEEAQKALRLLAQKEFEVNHVDEIAFECEVNYVDLERFDEYKDLLTLEQANLGDYITVVVDTFNIGLKMRVVKRVYDVLNQKRVQNIISTLDKLKKPTNIKDIVDKELGGFRDEVDNKLDNLEVGGYNYILNSDKCLTHKELNNYKQLNFALEQGIETINKLRNKNVVLSFDIEGEANFKKAGLLLSYEKPGETPYTVELDAKVETSHQGKQRLVAKFILH